MTFPLLSPAGLLLSLVLLTPTAGTTQSAEVSCNGADNTTIDLKDFSDMQFMSKQHEKKLYFISKVVDPDRNVCAFEKTCKGLLTKPFEQALLGEIKTKSEYDFVANFVNTSLPAGSDTTWAMLGIRSPTEKTISALKYLSTGETLAAVFRDDRTFWAIRTTNPIVRYPDWHRDDTCLFMDWSNATDKGRLGDGCCNKQGKPYNCYKTRYICQLDCSPPPSVSPPPLECPSSTSGQRSVHGGGGGGGVATSTMVGCLLGLLHYLHYTCSI